LLINILISALTTLIVLVLWNAGRPECAGAIATQPVLPTLTPTVTTAGQGNLPPLDQALVQVENIFGVNDFQNEVVLLRNISSGELQLKDWKMVDEQGNAFIFPELILAPNSAVQIYTRPGSNNPISLYWGLQAAAWQSQEKLRILDPLGQERASYVIP
ncbi:MAG TPA: lamin tail domain-containing protein, partial [Anaerolineaceae bacterium]|nr:lamin tail domain-containing protein [Anaerolineaceae bacterium]